MSPRPQDMGPADLAPNTSPPEILTQDQAKIEERNWFYNSLSPEAKERFLEAAEDATDQGLGDDEVWRRAVEAAEVAYVEVDEAEI